MSDFTGVVCLRETGRKYWVNVWQGRDKQSGIRRFALRLRAKEEPGTREWCCQLRNNPSSSIQYAGNLALTDILELCLECWEEAVEETGPSRLRIHFIADQRRVER